MHRIRSSDLLRAFVAAVGIALCAATPLASQVVSCRSSAPYLLPDRRPKPTVLCSGDVDTLAVVRPTALPVYPDMLLSAHVEGTVLVQFVVTARGQIDTATFRVLKSTHYLFTQSVRTAFAHWTAHAARLHGQPVGQLNQIEIDFDSTCVKPNRTPKSIVSGGWITVCPKTPAAGSVVQRPRNQRATLP